jgi:hypothetical protein
MASSSMLAGLLPNIPIAVDNFGKRIGVSIYFLTHFHSGTTIRGIENEIDHYPGLANEFDYGRIYCSEITKKLILHKFKQLDSNLVVSVIFHWFRIFPKFPFWELIMCRSPWKWDQVTLFTLTKKLR